MCFVVLLGVAYLAGLYYVLSFGVAAREKTEILEELARSVEMLEADTQRQEMGLADRHKEIIAAMDAVSSMTYLLQEPREFTRIK